MMKVRKLDVKEWLLIAVEQTQHQSQRDSPPTYCFYRNSLLTSIILQ
jgi:hypothetical protein